MTFTQAGLALGRGTILAKFEREGRAAGGLSLDDTEARLLSLLTAAYREPLGGGVIEKIRRAGEIWGAGEKALAQIHLAFMGLPKIDETDAYRLFLAGTALEKGVSPSELMKALGFPHTARDIEKYNPDQRVFRRAAAARAGNGLGRRGRWPRQTFVRRVEIRMAGATMSDANPAGIVPGAQFAELLRHRWSISTSMRNLEWRASSRRHGRAECVLDRREILHPGGFSHEVEDGEFEGRPGIVSDGKKAALLEISGVA
jgi:hypothetical protein